MSDRLSSLSLTAFEALPIPRRLRQLRQGITRRFARSLLPKEVGAATVEEVITDPPPIEDYELPEDRSACLRSKTWIENGEWKIPVKERPAGWEAMHLASPERTAALIKEETAHRAWEQGGPARPLRSTQRKNVDGL